MTQYVLLSLSCLMGVPLPQSRTLCIRTRVQGEGVTIQIDMSHVLLYAKWISQNMRPLKATTGRRHEKFRVHICSIYSNSSKVYLQKLDECDHIKKHWGHFHHSKSLRFRLPSSQRVCSVPDYFTSALNPPGRLSF